MAVFVKHPREWHHLTQARTGPFGRDMMRRGRLLRLLAMNQVGVDQDELRPSIKVTGDFKQPAGPVIRVGSSVPHARAHHDGTRAHFIRPRNARVLRFNQGGMVRYATSVWHPGTRPNRYLTDNLSRVTND